MTDPLQSAEFGSLGRSLRGSALANYAAFAIQVACSLVFTPLLLRSAGAEKFGLFSLAMSLGILLQLPFAGMYTATVQMVSSSAAGGDLRTARTTLKWGVPVALGAGLLVSSLAVLLVFLAPGALLPATRETSSDEVRFLFALTCLAVPFQAATHLLSGICAGLFRFRVLAAVNGAVTLGRTIVWILLLRQGGSLVQLLLVWLASLAVVWVLEVVAVVVLLSGETREALPARPVLGQLARQGGWLVLEETVLVTAGELDSYIISVMLSTSAAGHYVVGFKIPLFLIRLVCEVRQLFVPIAAAAQGKAEPRNLQSVLLSGTQAVAFLFIPAAAFFGVWAAPVLQWWIGPADPVVPILRVGLAVVTVQALHQVGYALMHGLSMNRTLAQVACLQALLRVCLALALARIFGAVGVALAVLVSVLVADGLLRPGILFHHLRLTWRLWVDRVVLPAICGAGILYLGFFWSFRQSGILLQALPSAATVVLYAFLAWKLRNGILRFNAGGALPKT